MGRKREQAERARRPWALGLGCGTQKKDIFARRANDMDQGVDVAGLSSGDGWG